MQNIIYNKAKFSTEAYHFDGQIENNVIYTSTAKQDTGFSNIVIDYFHYITIDVSSYSKGDLLYNRIYIQDENNDITEIPSDGTDFAIIKRFAFEFN